jgi:hypothetical protein
MRIHGRLPLRTFFRFFACFLLQAVLTLAALPSFGEELSVQYSLVARANVTPIPAGLGTFKTFGSSPAVDNIGNVLFTAVGGLDAVGKTQNGVYTSVGACCQKVADKNTLIPGGGGALFTDFNAYDKNDIDGGRVAFRANTISQGTKLGLYSNVGQASANTLVQVALNDNIEWSASGHPWVDGNVVAMRGQRLIPAEYTAFQLWNGSNGSKSFFDPGAGYAMGLNTQAAISGGAAIFRRIKTGASELVVSTGGTYEILVLLNTTPVPGQAGVIFNNVGNFPVIDRGGLDAAFRGNASNGSQGVYKRIDGGALQKVADAMSAVPGGGTPEFSGFPEHGVALANGKVVFLGNGSGFFTGLYTDIGGHLSVIADTGANNSIMLNGVTEHITGLEMNSKSFAYTTNGYTVVFWAVLESGGEAIIRATISTAPSAGSFTVMKDFSDNSTASVSVTLSCTSGTVTNNPRTATEAAPAVFNISGASAGATCTASESPVPTGYTANQAECQNGDPIGGSCTIVNTKNSGSFTVNKDFSDNSTASVSVTLSCTSGTVTNNPRTATEAAPAVFNISGASAGATCTASESPVPTGYTANQADCQNGDPIGGSCTIVNTKNSGSFTVNKDFSDNSTASLSVTLTCTSGTVTNNPRTATEAAPAVFTISGASPGATCTASESPVPTGYTANQADCQNGDPIGGSCTIVNTSTTPPDDVITYDGFEDGDAKGGPLSNGT